MCQCICTYKYLKEKTKRAQANWCTVERREREREGPMKKKTKSKNTTNPKKKKKKKASETIWLSSYASANLVPKETKDEPRANQTLNHEWRMVSPRFRFPSMQTPSSDLINFQHFLHYLIFLSFFCFCWKFSYHVIKILKASDSKSGLLARIGVIFSFKLSLNF